MDALRTSLITLLFAMGLAGLYGGPRLAHAQSAARSEFDHLTTGWPLDGEHRNADCERCHVAGIFKGTPRECFACHSRGGLIRSTAPPLTHIRSTQQCQDCHNEASWAAVWKVDHTQVLGSCGSCHNGVTATGKTPDHPPASNQCDLCHRTTTWRLMGSAAPTAGSRPLVVGQTLPLRATGRGRAFPSGVPDR